MRIIHVLRKPFSGPVAKNVLEHGTGALNIEACRVASTTARPLMEYFHKDGENKKGTHPTGMVYQGPVGTSLADGSRKIGETMKGRWPSNVILEHLPECKLVGTRKVPGSFTEGGGARPGGFGDVGAAKGGSVPVGRGYAGPDGTEAVDEWSCAPGCPVADCDGDSGVLRDRGNVAPTTGGRGTGHSWTTSLYISEHGSYDEGGGASRFFKQFGGDPDQGE